MVKPKTIALPGFVQDVLRGAGRSVKISKSGPATRVFLAHALLSHGVSPVIVVRDAAELASVKSLLRLLDPPAADALWDERWIIMPPFPPDASRMGHGAGWPQRLACLYALEEGVGARGLVVTADNLVPKWPPRDFFEQGKLVVRKGEELSSEMLLEQAALWGYERVTLVARPGEMAMRGDILDIFAPGYATPLRVEFFGDTIDDLRLFDPLTQRSRGQLQEAVVLPVLPCPVSGPLAVAAQERWAALRREEMLDQRQERALLQSLETGRGPDLPGIFYETSSFFENWLPHNPVFLLSTPGGVHEGPGFAEAYFEEVYWAWEQQREETSDNAPSAGLPRSLVLRDTVSLDAMLQNRRRLIFEELLLGAVRQEAELQETELEGFDELFARFRLDAEDVDKRADNMPDSFDQEKGRGLSKDRPWHSLVALLKQWQLTRRQTILAFHTEQGRKKFLKLAQDEGLRFSTEFQAEVQGLFALVGPLQKGYELHWSHSLVLGEPVLQPKGTFKARAKDRAFQGLKSYEGLAAGDLLVHRDYGLGRFGGLSRLDAGGVANDYLLLLFQGEDKLYLPVDRLSQVQPYKGPEGLEPSLDRLGGTAWVRIREKARKAIEKIAHDLVEMYAYRKVAKGYAYEPLNELYREFEASFGFEETPDQGRAIQDVLDDMEKPEPMDRLICGDVGFGKTEVALRASFRAALDNRQVALLCPTTVLAEQHYQNFKSRLQGFPVNVGMLSRFVPAKKQKQVLDAARRAQVDILIGTHRLLSQDVVLPNLGLLILDEEQRFGVKHKERLKKMRKNIDVLTLTATPIPRTLQLSLSGVRELSVIETPPRERKAVETAVVERTPELLRTILARELERGGQVFWVHNRVQGLEKVEAFVRGLAPDARIGQAHGQMPERMLEETMHKFWNGDLDILVCTAIIESGLDFPRANTLIVDQAQMFGLGQLYQLRGRVGRSDRQAYSYFVVPSVERLGEIARKRLKIIMDMDYLGAGFQVAMEDLRLRGAGNILGESQSGHIAKVGLDLFLEMLEEEVRRIKGAPMKEDTDPEISIGFPAHIPEDYMPDARERLKYYKGFSTAQSQEALLDLESEVRDRFGPLPGELKDFLEVLTMKRLLAKLQIVKADLGPGLIRMSWAEGTSVVKPQCLVEWVASRQTIAKLKPPSTLELRLDQNVSRRAALRQAAADLEALMQQSVAAA